MKFLLAEMTMIEAKESFKRTDLVILPVGATEAHGPHNPLFTDSTAALELSRRVGEKMNGMAIVAPLISYGDSSILMDFEGTITLRQETLLNLLRDVTNSFLHWGIQRIFFLNGHGGNIAAIATVARELHGKGVLCAAPAWWDPDVVGKLNERWASLEHGGFVETMLNLVAMPQGVRMDLYVPPNVGYQMTNKVKVDGIRSAEFKGGRITIYPSPKLIWPHGFSEVMHGIPANEATKEEGERMLEELSQYFADFLVEFRKAPLPAHE